MIQIPNELLQKPETANARFQSARRTIVALVRATLQPINPYIENVD